MIRRRKYISPSDNTDGIAEEISPIGRTIAATMAVLVLYVFSVFAASFFILLIASASGIDKANLQDHIQKSTFYNFLFMAFAMATELVLFFGLIRLWGLRRPSYLGVLNLWNKFWYVPLGIGAYYIISAVVLRLLAGIIDVDQKQEIGFTNVSGASEYVLVFLALVVFAPLAEEIIFRGFLFGEIRKNINFIWTACIVSIIFGAFHLQVESGNPLLWSAAADTAVLSLVACYVRERTGHIWYGLAMHSLKNCIAFVLLFILHVQV